METYQMEIISQDHMKIEPEWKDEILDSNEQLHLDLVNIRTSKLEEKLDIPKDYNYCIFQYTDIKTNLIGDNSVKIEEDQMHIKVESEQLLEEKLDIPKDYCVFQYTDSNKKKIEENEIHIKDESKLPLEDEQKVNTLSFDRGERIIHSGEKYFKCNICEKSFTRRTNLKQHLLIHSGEKNFKCNICEKSFTRRTNLKQHLLIHSGEKNFKCNICEKSFAHNKTLNVHLLIHSGEKNFKCNICEKSFTHKSTLNNHLLIHSGEKNFK